MTIWAEFLGHEGRQRQHCLQSSTVKAETILNTWQSGLAVDNLKSNGTDVSSWLKSQWTRRTMNGRNNERYLCVWTDSSPMVADNFIHSSIFCKWESCLVSQIPNIRQNTGCPTLTQKSTHLHLVRLIANTTVYLWSPVCTKTMSARHRLTPEGQRKNSNKTSNYVAFCLN